MIQQLLLNRNICLANPVDLFTYVNAATGKRSCLDLCFVSASLVVDTAVSTLDEVGSDHVPISVEIEREPTINRACFRKSGL